MEALSWKLKYCVAGVGSEEALDIQKKSQIDFSVVAGSETVQPEALGREHFCICVPQLKQMGNRK